jgi:hypothetical protein
VELAGDLAARLNPAKAICAVHLRSVLGDDDLSADSVETGDAGSDGSAKLSRMNGTLSTGRLTAVRGLLAVVVNGRKMIGSAKERHRRQYLGVPSPGKWFVVIACSPGKWRDAAPE